MNQLGLADPRDQRLRLRSANAFREWSDVEESRLAASEFEGAAFLLFAEDAVDSRPGPVGLTQPWGGFKPDIRVAYA